MTPPQPKPMELAIDELVKILNTIGESKGFDTKVLVSLQGTGVPAGQISWAIHGGQPALVISPDPIWFQR